MCLLLLCAVAVRYVRFFGGALWLARGGVALWRCAVAMRCGGALWPCAGLVLARCGGARWWCAAVVHCCVAHFVMRF